MSDQTRAMIEQIHATPAMIVLVVTGGGATAIGELLGVAGASSTVLEATVPYARTALAGWLDRSDGGADAEAALDMAMVAHRRAVELAAGHAPVFGVACTAALATLRDRRGSDRAHIAAVGDGAVMMQHLRLDRNDGREVQERLVSDAVLAMVAKACGVAPADPQA